MSRRTQSAAWLAMVVTAIVLSASVIGIVAAATDAPLISALKERDFASARSLTSKSGVDVNATEGDGATALQWAAHWDQVDIAAQLLKAGAKVDAANAYGVTALSLACVNGSDRMVDVLLGASANPNLARESGMTPLMACSRSGNAKAVSALLRKGADTAARDAVRGQTALMWAVAAKHDDVVRSLLEGGADLQARAKPYNLVVSVGGGGGGGRRGAPPAADAPPVPVDNGLKEIHGGFTPLLFAAREGTVESARLLIAAGANPNDASTDGTEALVVAAHSDNAPVAMYLLDHGADPNLAGAGYAALHAAVLRGNVALVKALLEHKANPNVKLMKGTETRRFSQVYSLPGNLAGATPLLLAGKFAEAEIMRALANGGADPTAKMPDGTTVLMYAAGAGWNAAEDGSSTDRRGRNVDLNETVGELRNNTATLEAVRAALEMKADVNAVNNAGDTAAHAAAGKKFSNVVELLGASGADLNLKNKRGVTPAELLKTGTAAVEQ
jgi:uncharacterized protein